MACLLLLSQDEEVELVKWVPEHQDLILTSDTYGLYE